MSINGKITTNPNFSDVLSVPSNPEDLFTLLYPIGTGGFGKVYKAVHKSTNQIYAIKIIDYTKDCNSNKKNICFNYESILQETSTMKLVNDCNYIVKYYGSYYSRKSNTLWLILEYCSCGSAVDLMLSMDRTLSEIEVSTIIEMILKGLIHIHKKNLIHRDVKGANILLSEDGYAKLGDFGVGIQLNNSHEYRTSKKGSPYWMSPQVVLCKNYDMKTDIWSLGITCIELVEGEPPNGELKPYKVMEKIAIDPPKAENFISKDEHTDDFIDFVNQCLEINPEKRPNAQQLLKHRFITKLAQGSEYLKKLIKDNISLVEKFREEEEERNKNNENVCDTDEEDNNCNKKKFNSDKTAINEEIISFNMKNDDNLKNNNSNSSSVNQRCLNFNDNNNSQNEYQISKNSINEKSESNNDYASVIYKEDNGNENTSFCVVNPENLPISNGNLNENNDNENNENNDNNNDNNELLSSSVNYHETPLNENTNKVETNNDNNVYPSFMDFINSDNFIYDDEKYLEVMKQRQLNEMKDKMEYLKKKKEEKNKENENQQQQNNQNKNVLSTPVKKHINNTFNNQKSTFDQNIVENGDANHYQKSYLTSNLTQANSKPESSDGRKIDSNNINNNVNGIYIKKNKKCEKNKNQFNNNEIKPLKLKLMYDNDSNEENEIENIKESDSEDDKVGNIKECITNSNNKFISKNYGYLQTETKDRSKYLKLPENITINANSINGGNEWPIHNSHISLSRMLKKYFN